MVVKKYGARFWAVYDEDGMLVCVTVYKKGAVEVCKRLSKGRDNYEQSKQN